MKILRTLAGPALLVLLSCTVSGCVYYNTFYNARKRYADAEKKRHEIEAQDRTDDRQAVASYRELYMAAIRKASVILDQHPKSKWVDDSLLLIGKAFYWRGAYNEALTKFKELQSNFPKSPLVDESRYWQGLTLWAMGRTNNAHQVLSDLSQQTASAFSGKARFSLAQMEAEQGNYESAIKSYQSLLAEGKEKKLRAEIWQSIGNANFQMGTNDQALRAYRKVLSSGPDPQVDYHTRLQIGAVLERQGRFKEAMETYEKILKIKRLQPYRPEVHLRQANVYRMMNHLDTAVETYDEVIKDNPRTDYSAEAYYEMGLIEQKQRKDLKKAGELFEKARRERPSSPAGELARERQDDLSDLERYRRISSDGKKDDKETLEALFNMAGLYLFNFTEPDSALAVYKRALELADTTRYAPKALYAIGVVYADSLKNPAAARKAFQALINTYPVSSYAIQARERLKEKDTEDVRAEASFLEADSLRREGGRARVYLTILKRLPAEYPKSLYAPKALYTLAWTYENRLGEPDTARAYYQRLIDRYPLSEFAGVAREKLTGGFLPKPESPDSTQASSADTTAAKSANPASPARKP